MFELQSEFAFRVLLPMVHILHMPLISIENTKEQKEPVAGYLMICNSKDELRKREEEFKNEKIISW